jgi:type I restriction enzyme S subunit
MAEVKLPEGWFTTTIDEIAEIKGGKRLPKGKALLNAITEHPYVRVTDFQDGSVDISNLKYLDSDTFASIKNYTISKDDLYISIAGTIGLVGEIPDSIDGANLTENAAKICKLTGVHKKYLRYVLNSISAKEQFEDKTTSSGQPKLALFRIKDCTFPLPPKAEQKVIADKLDTLLAHVEITKARLDRIPQILKTFRQSVLSAAVSGKLTEDWRKEKQFKKAKTPHNKKLPNIENSDKYTTAIKNWEWVRLGSVVELINGDRGKNYPNKSEYVETGIPFVNTGHIQANGTLSNEKMNFITKKKYDTLGGGKTRPSDLVYCLRGATMGKTARVNYENGAIASSLVIVRSGSKIDKEFAYYFLISPESKKLIKDFDNGSAQPNLSAMSLASYPLQLPSIEEQNEIVRRVEQFFAYADRAERQVQDAQHRVDKLTQSILAKAFRGELTNQWRSAHSELISGDNSAEALLAEIKAERKKLSTAVNAQFRKI